MQHQSDRPGLGIDELRARALELAADPNLPIPAGAEVPGLDQRPFVLVVDDDEKDVNGWVIGWPVGTDTGFHDHDGARAVVIGLGGEVVEERPVFGGGAPVSRVCAPDVVIELTPDVVHRMHNRNGTDVGYTLHVYSPKLDRQGLYRLVEGKSIVRVVVDGGEELRPLKATGEL